MNYEELIGKPDFIGEIRIIKESPIPRKPETCFSQWFPERTIYLKSTSYGTWIELYERDIEELYRKGKL